MLRLFAWFGETISAVVGFEEGFEKKEDKRTKKDQKDGKVGKVGKEGKTKEETRVGGFRVTLQEEFAGKANRQGNYSCGEEVRGVFFSSLLSQRAENDTWIIVFGGGGEGGSYGFQFS